MLLILGLAGAAAASDPLTLIPADAPLVLGFRDLAGSAKKLELFLQEQGISCPPLDLDEVQRGFHLDDGVVDTAVPVFLVLTRPKLEESAFALVFKPRDAEAFAKQIRGNDGDLKACEGPEGAYWLAMRDEFAVVALNSRALRPLRRLPVERSLAGALGNEEKAIFASSDVFAHIPLDPWRERIQPLVFLATNMIRLTVQSEGERTMPDMSAAMIEWLAAGVQTIFTQMGSLTLAVDFDGETFGLTHHHAFASGGSVAGYLGKVQRRGLNLWELFPDRPFFVIGAFDWQCPGESSITSRFNEFMFLGGGRQPARVVPEEARERLRKSINAVQGQMWGSAFMAAPPPQQCLPVQLYGGYALEDASAGIKDLVYLQDNATEAMATFMGEQFFGKFQQRSWEGPGPLYEMLWDAERMDPLTRKQISAIYGPGVRVQEAMLDEHHIVYTAASAPAGVDELLRVRKSSPHLGRNADFRKMLTRLPKEPNAVIVLDVPRCLAALPAWLQGGPKASGRSWQPALTTSAAATGECEGRLIGWSGTVHPRSFTGRVAIGADDAVAVAKLLRQMAEGLSKEGDASVRPQARPPLR